MWPFLSLFNQGAPGCAPALASPAACSKLWQPRQPCFALVLYVSASGLTTMAGTEAPSLYQGSLTELKRQLKDELAKVMKEKRQMT